LHLDRDKAAVDHPVSKALHESGDIRGTEIVIYSLPILSQERMLSVKFPYENACVIHKRECASQEVVEQPHVFELKGTQPFTLFY
jgi:hypothetical protein